jgi:glycogen operon protein
VQARPRHVLLMMHAGKHPREFAIPQVPKPIRWRLFLDTGRPSPDEIYPRLDGPQAPPSGRVTLDHHAMMVWVSSE